jgi:nucleotide-binding universal stress UspA family protein
MQRILVPTDFSDNAWNALKYGLELFNKTRCTFYLLHVDPIPPYSGAGTAVREASENYRESLLKKSRENLQKLLMQIEKLPFNTKHTFETIAVHDYFLDTIKRESTEKKIDLIIMGTKGAGGLKKATVGSNTGDAITKIKCPLLAVPGKAVYSNLKEIAFPTDYHINYDIRVLNTLISMAVLHNATVRVLHLAKQDGELSEEQLKNKEFLNDYLADVAHSFHSLTGKVLDSAVQYFTESSDVDMIAMVAKNLNFFQRILFRPTVEKISYHTKVPFLVLHE